MSFGGLYNPLYTPGFGSRPRLQTTHPFRSLVAAGSNLNNQWSGDTGHSGYGYDAPDYDYHSGLPAHVPSAGSYSYHATAGTAYGPPPPPAAHPPAKPTVHAPAGGNKKGIFGGGGGKRGSSVMSALTLLSFLFFINLLQGCIKDHMDAMNPTVMVMTTNVIRNRFNKMGEMNSREQGSSSNAANIVMQPADSIQSAVVQTPSVMHTTRPSVNLQSIYSNNPVSYNKPIEQPISQIPYQHIYNTADPEVPINYAKPQYDPHKLDPYNHLPQSHHSLSYDNHSLSVQPPPPPLEQHYSFHHTEYNAQPPPQPSSPLQNPFYEHQDHQVAPKPYNSNYSPQYDGTHPDYDFRKKYENTQQPPNPHFSHSSSSSDNGHPWSSNSHTSSAISGPFRRASITAVSPRTKWITVPAKIIDRTDFVSGHGEDIKEHIEHHDDRDVFRSRFNSN